jgi:hypothetical protein
VLFHQLGQHFVLLIIELSLQEGDALLAGLDLLVGPKAASPFSKNSFSQRGVNLILVAQDRNGTL